MNAPELLAHPLVADPSYHRLKDHLIATTGLTYYADKDRELAGRIAEHLARTGLPNCATYLDLLENGQSGHVELDALIEDLTIGETFFFRHREMFEAIRAIVLPDLMERNQHSRQLRVWSAGCSTGAEPYSLAVLFKRDLADRLAGWNISIIGTDINRAFLARAREGIFDEWTLRATPEDVKLACFTRTGTRWRLLPAFKECVSLQYHNLVAHPFPSFVNNLFAFDLILCRNVMIYFSQEIVRRLIGHFHECLVNGGWLLVGHAEPNLDLFRSFRPVNAPGAVLYQKCQAPAALTHWVTPPLALPEIKQEMMSCDPEGGAWPATATPAGSSATSLPPPPSTISADEPEAALDAIRAHADRGEWERALACCQAALEENLLNPLVYFYQGLVLEQMGRHPDAEHSLRRALYLDRSYALGHYYLGLLLQKQGRLAQAARSFRNALQLLERTDASVVLADGDGITGAELQELARTQLEVLEGE